MPASIAPWIGPLSWNLGRAEIDNEDVYFLRDNGIGFESEFSERIFQPFERLHRYADIPGTGIGLSNVKRAIERHGGRIWAESQPGKGSTFYFTIGAEHALAEERRNDSDFIAA